MTEFHLPVVDGKPMTQVRLREVFNLVKPVGNWKNPISARVPTDQATLAEITEAVVWFAGGVPEIVEEDGAWSVVGAGYYTWIGA